MLHLGLCNPGHTYRLRDKRLECSPAESSLGVPVGWKLHTSQQCAPAAQSADCTLGCLKHDIGNQRKGVIVYTQHWCDPTCCVRFGPPQVVYKNSRMCPKESNREGERTRGHDLPGAAEDTWFLQLKEETEE